MPGPGLLRRRGARRARGLDRGDVLGGEAEPARDAARVVRPPATGPPATRSARRARCLASGFCMPPSDQRSAAAVREEVIGTLGDPDREWPRRTPATSRPRKDLGVERRRRPPGHLRPRRARGRGRGGRAPGERWRAGRQLDARARRRRRRRHGVEPAVDVPPEALGHRCRRPGRRSRCSPARRPRPATATSDAPPQFAISLSAAATEVGPMEEIYLTGVYPGGEGAVRAGPAASRTTSGRTSRSTPW